MNPVPTLPTLCAALLASTLLGACNRPVAQQYDIVTRTRPQSQADYLQTSRGLHQVCNATRAMMHLPPGPPLLTLPADFATERTHYLASSGKFLTRRENFFIDTTGMRAEAGCTARIVSEMTEELVQNGQVQSSRTDPDGKRELAPAESLPPARQDVAQPYTERKTVGSMALRCIPANTNPLGAVMQDLCAPESGSGIALDGRGEAIVVQGRAMVAGPGNMVSLTEPVSVQIGQPVDSAALTLSAGK